MARPSTGIDALDDLLGRLGVGDNVVWQAPDPADIEPFVEAFLTTARGDTPLTYVSFRLSPAAVLDRFGEVWDSDRFTLLDGWTGSQHASSEPSVAVAGLPPQALVRRLKDPTDSEQVNRELSEIEDDLGPGARYVFDDLTSMQRLWGPEPALALFLRCCPRLYQEHTVAYWLLERDAHPPTSRSQLADITQFILDPDTTATQPAERTLQVVKADGHSPAVLGRTLRYAVGDNGAIDVLRTASGTRERICLDDLQGSLGGLGRGGVEIQDDLGDVGQLRSRCRRMGVPFEKPVGDGALLVEAGTAAQEQRQGGLWSPEPLHAGQVVEHIAGARAKVVLDLGQLTVDLLGVGGVLEAPHQGLRWQASDGYRWFGAGVLAACPAVQESETVAVPHLAEAVQDRGR